jgi:hypothetical protein
LFCLDNNLKALKRLDFYKQIQKTGIQEKRTNKTRLFDITFQQVETEEDETIELTDVAFETET